uniref:Uncharacterized protein n=1 Tax=Ixodes ricinus TaxID=34613 RepID=A0A131XZR3_IXORI
MTEKDGFGCCVLDEVWNDLTFDFTEEVRDKWRRLICRKYMDGARHHHNLDHLSHMMGLFRTYQDYLSNPKAVAFALFFQFLEYDPKSQDNEERCIEAFRQFADEARIPMDSELFLTVTELIQLTKLHSTEEHKQEGIYGSEDRHFFLDFDMCVLGGSPSEYKDYAQKIRLEYSFVPDHLYNRLRSKILTSFLQIPNIFATEPFRRKFEERAKSNIKAEIEMLTS